VNLAAIISAGDPTTNYQLMPGDRLVVYRDPIVRTTIFIDRLAAPFQTVLNSMLQYGFTARTVKSINVPLFFGGTTGGTSTGAGAGAAVQPGAR
jgi:polysaccharide export outer membrane protein